MVATNMMTSMLHAPYVRSFSGFDRPWGHLEQLVEDVHVRVVAFGNGYVMTGPDACVACAGAPDPRKQHR